MLGVEQRPGWGGHVLQEGLEFVRPNFLQNEVRVKCSSFHVCSIVAKFIPMNMHVCVNARKGNLFFCQMQITGEILLAKFCRRSLRQSF